MGWSFQWTDNDHTLEDDATRTQYSRDRVHIKPIPGDAPTPPAAKVYSERREEGASVPVDMPSIKEPEAEIPMKQRVDNPSDSIKASQPSRIIKAPVKYG